MDMATKRIENTSYAVLLIDADYGSFDSYFNLEQELDNMKEVLKKANEQNIPVFEINFSPLFDRPSTTPLLAGLRKSNWIQIYKEYADAFLETPLKEKLSSMDITSIIVMGYNQWACVWTTAESAIELGYKIYTSFDIIQGDWTGECELIINGCPQGKTKDYCSITPDPELAIEVQGVESNIEEAKTFYNKNTHLVPHFYDLPIFKSPLTISATGHPPQADK